MLGPARFTSRHFPPCHYLCDIAGVLCQIIYQVDRCSGYMSLWKIKNKKVKVMPETFTCILHHSQKGTWSKLRYLTQHERKEEFVPAYEGGGGGRGYLTKFNTGRLRPEVQPLALWKGTPFLGLTFYWKNVPLSVRATTRTGYKISCHFIRLL